MNIADEINTLHEQFSKTARTAIEIATQIGGLLSNQKNSLAQGEWLPWVTTNLSFGVRQAQRYLKVFENRDELKCDPGVVFDKLTLKLATQKLSKSKEQNPDLVETIRFDERENRWVPRRAKKGTVGETFSNYDNALSGAYERNTIIWSKQIKLPSQVSDEPLELESEKLESFKSIEEVADDRDRLHNESVIAISEVVNALMMSTKFNRFDVKKALSFALSFV